MTQKPVSPEVAPIQSAPDWLETVLWSFVHGAALDLGICKGTESSAAEHQTLYNAMRGACIAYASSSNAALEQDSIRLAKERSNLIAERDRLQEALRDVPLRKKIYALTDNWMAERKTYPESQRTVLSLCISELRNLLDGAALVDPAKGDANG